MPTKHRLLLLFFGITLLFSLGNSALPLIDRDEPRFAEASREMMDSGNWVVPSFNNAPRYDKPPLIYWLQIASYKTLGVNEFAARLPSALCTALTAILLILWGSRIADPITGIRAGTIFILCLQLFIHGRASVADLPMVLCVTAAAWAGWEWVQRPRSHSLAFLFWSVLALGFLAKGPIAWLPIGMTAWLSWQRSKEKAPTPSPLAWVTGSVVMLILVGLWGIPALIATKGAFAAKGLGEHIIGRSLIAMEGHGAKSILGYVLSLPFYFATVFASFFPWSIWLPSAVLFYKRSRTQQTAYLICGVLLTFGIFTISRTKLPHYTLPAFPLIALLLALWWKEHKTPDLFRKTVRITAAAFVFVPLFIFPRVAALSATEAMVWRLASDTTAETAVALTEYQEPSLIWGVRKLTNQFPEIISETNVEQWLSRPGPRVCIVTAAAAEKITGPWVRKEAKGWNFAKGRRVHLIALSPVPDPIQSSEPALEQSPSSTPGEKASSPISP